MRILLIEPCALTRRSIEQVLTVEGFHVEATEFAEEGADLAQHYAYDALVLCLETEDVPALSALRGLRRAAVLTPVIALSSHADVETEVAALGAGADDFVRKPFHREVLVNRLNALIRRSRGGADPVLTVGRITVHTLEKTVQVDGKALHLTGREYQIIETLALRPGHTFSREAMMTQLYGGRDEPEPKIVDVFVCKLRNKLKALGVQHQIETNWGRGYRLVAERTERIYMAPSLAQPSQYQTGILDRLAAGEAMFPELWNLFPSTSESTIRGAIWTLIHAGRIERVGEPRCAVYRLNASASGEIAA